MTNSLTSVTTILLLLTVLTHVHGIVFPTGCNVSVTDGNFDNGQFPFVPENANFELGQWETPRGSVPGFPGISIASPGFNGPHALQLDFPASKFTDWFFLQEVGEQCEGSQYFMSFAVNWLNFTALHGDLNKNFCRLEIGLSICSEEGQYNATDIPGWQVHNFTCTAIKNSVGSLVVNFGCETDYINPAFSLQFADFSAHLITNSTSLQSTSTPTSTLSLLPSSSTPPTFSGFPSSTTTTPSITLSATTSSTNILTPSTTVLTTSVTLTNIATSPTDILTTPTTIPTSSVSLTNIATSPTDILTTPTTIPTSSVSLTNIATNSTVVPTTFPTNSTTISANLTSPSAVVTANKAGRISEIGFVIGLIEFALFSFYII